MPDVVKTWKNIRHSGRKPGTVRLLQARQLTSGRKSAMKAVRLTEWESPPVLDDIEIPEPGPGQVLLKVAGAGLCHSDLHLMEWPEGVVPYDLPFTLGHENAGWVARTGAGVANFGEGDAVLVYGPWGCGTCWTCAQG